MCSLVLTSCAPLDEGTATLVGKGHTFRDLRQHTFSNDKDTSYPQIAVSPAEDQVAVVKYQSGNHDVFIKKINSRAMTQKTFHKSDDAYPAFSPDGSKLAFASNRNGNWDIYVMNTYKGKAKRQITSSSAHDIAPSWSADGTKITYCSLSRSTGEWEIWLFNLVTGAVTNLVPGKYPTYAPHDDIISFQRAVEDDASKKRYYALWTIDDEGNTETLIVSSAKQGYINPSWSPDGKKLVFSAGGQDDYAKVIRKISDSEYSKLVKVGKQETNIWTVNIDGTNHTQLTSHEKGDWWPAWGKDGRIYFSSERDRFQNIWSVIPEFVTLN
jgi:TolB protein